MLGSILSLYSPKYPLQLVALLRQSGYQPWAYIKRYWQTQDFSKLSSLASPSLITRVLSLVLVSGMILQVAVGGLVIYFALHFHFLGSWTFGLALIIVYPIVWAHVLILAGVFNVITMKRYGKAALCIVLERQVRALRHRHDFMVVAVAGSVGKTSTKLAIAKLLASQKRVIYQDGNYNDRLTVPLVLFGETEPASLFNIFAWARIILRNKRALARGYPYDIAVLELGSDGPGQIQRFRYLRPDIAVITAVAPEHMEFFGTIDAVAVEELSVAAFSKRLLINADDISLHYLKGLSEFTTYGLNAGSDYGATFKKKPNLSGQAVTVSVPDGTNVKVDIAFLGQHGVKIFLGAFAVADMLGLDRQATAAAAKTLQPGSGRMQILPGKNGSIIIDDTYNSSPLAATAALDVLYSAKATKRIAILGSMNELGDSSESAHKEVGEYCDPHKIDLLITLGPEANDYLAPVAEANGCRVEKFSSPYEVGARLVSELQPGCVVLAKGSQNRVYAEEAVKQLLQNPDDESKLVRQSKAWLAIKRRQFNVSAPSLRVH